MKLNYNGEMKDKMKKYHALKINISIEFSQYKSTLNLRKLIFTHQVFGFS